MIPVGWTIHTHQSVLGVEITVVAPNGYGAVLTSFERNPANILYMLAKDLLEQPLPDVSGRLGYPRHPKEQA